ncbi:MAG: UMP kinase [Candidatus Falkowbacteria bacterium]
MSKLFVLSIGGSLIAPDQIDVNFIKKIKNVLEKKTALGSRFAIVAGGGGAARKYQKALKQFNRSSAALDEVGIAATRLNATLLRLALWPTAGNSIFLSPEDVEFEDQSMIIGGGWKPGWSTDYVAVLLAKKFNADCVVNLSNIDYVYTKDPRKFPDAEAIKNISWADFKKIVGNEWVPGANLPFDPIASKFAEENNIAVIVMNGDNLENFLDGKEFVGTKIG